MYCLEIGQFIVVDVNGNVEVEPLRIDEQMINVSTWLNIVGVIGSGPNVFKSQWTVLVLREYEAEMHEADRTTKACRPVGAEIN